MNLSRPQIFQKEFCYQYFAAFLVNLTAFIFGIVIGFTGPNLELFKSEESPLGRKITIDEESWISSLASLGAIGFTLAYGWVSERFGRRTAILLIGIPQTASWIFMAFASNVQHIYISRVLSGVAGAGCFFVVPVYIAEISDKKVRGELCASFSVICNLGIFLEFILAEYMDFRDAAVLIAIISALFVIGFTFMPESPQYLVSKKRFDEAEVAFKFFRGLSANEPLPEHYTMDFNSIKEISKGDNECETQLTILLKHLTKPGVLKGIFMAAVVSHFPIMSGCFVLITYNQGIFKAADLTVLNVFWSSLAFAFIQIIASLFTAKFVDRVGRRKILVGSSFSSAFCLAIFGAYMYLKTKTDIDVTSITWITWIPLVSLLVEVFVSSIGIIPVPNFYGPEILDQKIRSLVVSTCSWSNWIFGFLIIKFYPSVESSIGLYACILFFAFTCCFCGLFTLAVLPETKGRNIEEIAKSISDKERK